MTDFELSLAIANHLEPSPTVPHFPVPELPDFSGQLPDWVTDLEGDFYTSERNCWVWIYRGQGGHDIAVRDMVNDPEMTLVLMENIIRNCSHAVFQHWPDGCRLDIHQLERQTVRLSGEHVGRVVAEAFAVIFIPMPELHR